MNKNVFEKRQKQLHEKLKEEGMEGIVILGEKQWGADGWRDYNIFYLTGYSVPLGSGLLVIPLEGEPVLLIDDEWDVPQCRRVTGFYDVRGSRSLGKDFASIIKEKKLDKGKVGLVGTGTTPKITDILPMSFSLGLEELSDVAFYSGAHIIDNLRLIKDPFEQELIRQAGKIGDACSERLFEVAHLGVSEREIAAEVWKTAQQLGAEDIHISITTGFPNYWNHLPSEKKLEKDDFLMIEISPRYKGYFIQLVRMGVVGKITKEWKDLFHIERNTYLKARDAMRPGVPVAEAFKAAEEVVVDSVCGILDPTVDIGHGCATALVEQPILTKTNQLALQKGMSMVLHPIVFFPYIQTSFMLGDQLLVIEGGVEEVTMPQTELRSF